MQHLTDYYILYLLLICRIFLKYGTGNVMNNKVAEADRLADDVFTIQNGQLVSVFSEEERKAIRRNALSFLPFPDDEID